MAEVEDALRRYQEAETRYREECARYFRWASGRPAAELEPVDADAVDRLNVLGEEAAAARRAWSEQLTARDPLEVAELDETVQELDAEGDLGV